MSHIDTTATRYTKLRIEPYNPLIGATVHGVDLADARDETLRAELRHALAEFQVLFFRKQTLTPDQQLAVAKVFGDPDKAKAFFPRLEGYKAVELLEKAPNVPRYGTDQWHADITFQANPPTGTVLYARKIPPIGGDTAWASTTRAFEALPKELQAYLETLEAVHSFEHSGWPAYFEQLEMGANSMPSARRASAGGASRGAHAPVTGKKILYVSPNFTDKIKGLPRQQERRAAHLPVRSARKARAAGLAWRSGRRTRSLSGTTAPPCITPSPTTPKTACSTASPLVKTAPSEQPSRGYIFGRSSPSGSTGPFGQPSCSAERSGRRK